MMAGDEEPTGQAMSRASPPCPEQFGVSDAELAGVRPPFVAAHRGPLCLAVIGALLLTSVVATTSYSGSLAAGLLLAPLLVVASLVIVLPATMVLVCGVGHLEERWRARRDPRFDACRRYRDALARFEAAVRQDRGRARTRQQEWLTADSSRLLEAAAALVGAGATSRLDRRESGADLMVRHNASTTVIRAEPGPHPVDVAVARELAMARLDLDAGDAVLVAPAGGTAALRRYIADRPIRLLALSDLGSTDPL
jgi:hypothetical protein